MKPVPSFPVQELAKSTPYPRSEAVSQLPRRACAQQLAHHQAQVKSSHMDQLSLEDVFVSAQMAAPQSSGFVAVRKASFQQFAASPE